MVRCAITTARDNIRCKTRSPRIEKDQKLGTAIMEHMTVGEREIYVSTFDNLSTALMGILKGFFHTGATYWLSASKREKKCLLELPGLWENFRNSCVECISSRIMPCISNDPLNVIKILLKAFQSYA